MTEMLEPSRGGEIREEALIYHVFADEGVESEPLSSYGTVVRVGLDPQENQFSQVVQSDVRDWQPDEEADLGFYHPPCAPWSRLTRISGNQDDHEKLISMAREHAKGHCKHYVLENVPEAPLDDPTILTGKMFGLPIAKERAFETSFPVEWVPPEQDIETEVSPYFSADRSTPYWRGLYGVSGDYRKEQLVKGGLPSAYVHHLMRAWLRAIHPTDSQKARASQ